jgi:hypothetical protein
MKHHTSSSLSRDPKSSIVTPSTPGEPLFFLTRQNPVLNLSIVHSASKRLSSWLNRSLCLILLVRSHEPFIDPRIVDSPALYVSGTLAFAYMFPSSKGHEWIFTN